MELEVVVASWLSLAWHSIPLFAQSVTATTGSNRYSDLKIHSRTPREIRLGV